MPQKSIQDDVAVRVQSILAAEAKPGPVGSHDADDASSSDSDDKTETSSQIRGKRAGNRFWKKDRKRFSSVVATRGLKKITWEQKEKLRGELKHAKNLTRTLKEDRARSKQELRDRRQENLKRREENAKKSEVVHVIKNTAKLKRLKKKQLRNIEKRDTSGMV